MSKYFITVIGAVAIMLHSSCKKAGTGALDTAENSTGTEITISLPRENQVFNTGDTVFVRATATCRTEMHGCKAHIVNKSGDTLFSQSMHTHGTVVVVDDYWVNTLKSTADLQLIVAATIDHDGKTVDKKLFFKVQ